MPHFPEGVIRGVGRVIYRALVNQSEPVCDSLLRWLDLYAAHNLGGITRAAFCILDCNFEIRERRRRRPGIFSAGGRGSPRALGLILGGTALYRSIRL